MSMTIMNNIFIAFLLHIYNCHVYERKNSNKVILLIAWSGVVISFSMQELYDGKLPIVNMLLFLLPYLAVTLMFYQANRKRILLYTFYFYLMGICCELIAYYGTYMLLGVDRNDYTDKILQIISNILMFVVIRLLVLIFGKADENEIKLADFLEVLLIPAGSIYLIICFYVMNDLSDGAWNLFAVFVIIGFNIMSYYFYIKLQENMTDKYKNLLLEIRIYVIYKRVKELRNYGRISMNLSMISNILKRQRNGIIERLQHSMGLKRLLQILVVL